MPPPAQGEGAPARDTVRGTRHHLLPCRGSPRRRRSRSAPRVPGSVPRAASAGPRRGTRASDASAPGTATRHNYLLRAKKENSGIWTQTGRRTESVHLVCVSDYPRDRRPRLIGGAVVRRPRSTAPPQRSLACFSEGPGAVLVRTPTHADPEDLPRDSFGLLRLVGLLRWVPARPGHALDQPHERNVAERVLELPSEPRFQSRQQVDRAVIERSVTAPAEGDDAVGVVATSSERGTRCAGSTGRLPQDPDRLVASKGEPSANRRAALA